MVEQCWPIISCKSAKPLQSIARNNGPLHCYQWITQETAKPSFVVALHEEQMEERESSQCAIVYTEKKM